MVYSFETPRSRISDSFYRPETSRFVEKSFRKIFKEGQPIKDLSVFERSARRREVRSHMRAAESAVALRTRSSSMPPAVDTSFAENASATRKATEEVNSLRMNHPYRLPVEDLHYPLAEDVIWPANRPHFHLVSSYDLMLKYLGLDSLRTPYPGTGTYLVK